MTVNDKFEHTLDTYNDAYKKYRNANNFKDSFEKVKY